MNRVGLVRRTVLQRRTPLIARIGLRRKVPNRQRRDTGPSAEVVALVYKRAGFACELCDGVRGVDHQLHHRRPRGMGGTRRASSNCPSALLLLCPDCHREIESNRSAGLAGGWLVKQNQDPAQVPVLIHGECFWLLTRDGRYAEPSFDDLTADIKAVGAARRHVISRPVRGSPFPHLGPVGSPTSWGLGTTTPTKTPDLGPVQK